MSIAFIVFVIAVMVVRAFTTPVQPTADAWQFANTGVTRAISIMAYAFVCHHNSFLIYDSMVDANAKRWGVVTHVSIMFSMICTLVLGITGYTTFTGFTQGDILENYCRTDDVINVARFLFAAAVILTYPVECFVTREVIENAVFAFKQPPSTLRHIVVTVIIVLLTVLVSLTTDCVGIVLELNGVINAAPLAYILPALCVLKLQQDRIASWHNLPCILTALFGVGVSLVGFIMAVIEIAAGLPGCSHGHEMPYCAARPANQTQHGW
jgi:sodium-coupled neutral amino acid transporter 11